MLLCSRGARVHVVVGIKENLAKMTDDEFKQHVEALILTKLEEPKKMSHQLEIYWNEVVSHQYNFDRGKHFSRS